MPRSPIRIAIANDYSIVVAGLATVLVPYEDRVRVVELDSQVPVEADVDIVLYDTFGQRQGRDMDLRSLHVGSARFAVYSWNTQPELVEAALDNGAAGYLSKGLDADQLVSGLERIAAGERVTPETDGMPDGDAVGSWPGQAEGLSARESEVLALLCQGLSNQEIADRGFIGLNTVKTHLRTVFGKIGVDSRTRALLWGIDHGFRPDVLRAPGPHAD